MVEGKQLFGSKQARCLPDGFRPGRHPPGALQEHGTPLRYPESTEQRTLPSREKKAVVDASLAFAPSSSGKDDETVDVDFGRKDDRATGSFWTFDDAQDP